MIDWHPNKNRQTPNNNFTLSSYVFDFFLFVLIVVIIEQFIMVRFYALFFTGESSAAFMQFTYYVEALNNNWSLYWDHYLMLATQEMPTSPLLSPVTLLLASVAAIFNITELVPLAYMYAFACYASQVLCAFSMYLFLRYIGLGRLAAIIGGIGYGFNSFIESFGLTHGYFRLSAIAMMPIVCIFFIKLFNDRKNTLYYISLSGFLLGIAFVLNGDVKPTIYFIPILALLAYTEGYETHGTKRVTWILLAVFSLGALITLAQFYPTFETLSEGVRAERTNYLPSRPLYPINTLLGFSQNPFSTIIGFFFPYSFFNYYRESVTLGIAATHLHEQKFTYGIFFFLLSSVGLFYRTKRHLLWALSFLLFAFYILGSSTPLWPLFGFISEHAHLRYPTRASIMLYFLFSIYAAYGLDVLLGRSGKGDFYEKYFSCYVRYLYPFIGILILGLIVTTLQIHFDIFTAISNADYLTLFISRVLVFILLFTLASAAYISFKSSFRMPAGKEADLLLGRIRKSKIPDYFFYILIHIFLSWFFLSVTLKAYKILLTLKEATPDELVAVFFVEATLPLAIAIFTCTYMAVSFLSTRAFAVLRPGGYVTVIIISALLFNVLIALDGGVGAIHAVHLSSLVLIAVMIFFILALIKRYGPVDLDGWKEKPYFLKHTALAVVVLFSILFALFIFSGFMKNYSLAPHLFFDLGGLMLSKEITIILISIGLFLLTIVAVRKWSFPVVIVILSLGTFLYLSTAIMQKSIPATLEEDQSIVFNRDVELLPIYEDNGIVDNRIYIPRTILRTVLSQELGFSKSHHTYCCRQYKDRLRFAFGQIVGPKTLESIRKSITGDYSHPFWKLYNVGYIVDRFDLDPALLPKERASYERLSDVVIKLNNVRPLLYFMDSYEYMDVDKFLAEVRSGRALDMEDKLYIHDMAGSGVRSASSGINPVVDILDFGSGRLLASVDAPNPGFVVFSEMWAPSWTVYVNGERRSSVRAYGMLQAVWVEKGESEIFFEYNIFHSTKMRLAVLLSSLALLFVIVVVARRSIRGLDRD